MDNKLKSWQGWALFGGSLVVVFILGIICSALMERGAEGQVQATDTGFNDSIVSQNEKFAELYPHEYETWAMTEDTTFESMYNGSQRKYVLEEHPDIVIMWAGYAFSREYNTPRGHKHCIDDLRDILRTYAPGIDDVNNPEAKSQPATCWTCKGPDVPRLMREKGIEGYYAAKWADWGPEVMNTVGCSDCHDARNMNLRPARPAIREAWAARGLDWSKVSHNEMRSLVCAQCHVEYYFKSDPKNYLKFPWDKGMTCEAAEAYYDSIPGKDGKDGFYDFINPLSKAKIIKAQHPGYEMSLQGIHAQRGVSCADCHMPYMKEGGVKFTDHHVMSPLAHIDRTCQTCHRQNAETLRQNVYDREKNVYDYSAKVDHELAMAHIQAQFAWAHGATETEMAKCLSDIRKSQWRWDYCMASHGAAFHAPQEVMRLLAAAMEYAKDAQLEVAKVCAKHNCVAGIPQTAPYKTMAEAQKYIGLDMPKLKAQKKQFIEQIVPKWIQSAKKAGKLIEM